MGDRVVTLYGRAGCHLCDEALLLLERLAPEFGFSIEQIDVDQHAELLARFDALVPVIAAAGAELARAPISEQTLRQQLPAALREDA